MGRLIVELLGAPSVRQEDRILRFPTRKTLAILVYLLVEGGVHRRDKLVDLFWPESDTGAGRATLRATLVRLRTAIGETAAESHLHIDRDSVAFDAGSDFELDLHRLRDACEAARRLGGTRGPTGSDRQSVIEQLQHGANAWHGEFMEGFAFDDAPDFDDWISLQRRDWQGRMEIVLDRLSHLHTDLGESAQAIELVNRWIRLNPLEERAYRRLIRLQASTGDRTAALISFEVCRSTLDRELGVPPQPETLALAERVRADSIQPRAGAQPDPQGSPDMLFEATLVGRADEFSTLVERFHLAGRGVPQAVVIQGEAGIGKTRLASEFLAWSAAQGADTLRGRAFEAGARLPYQPLIDAIRPRLENEVDLGSLLGLIWLAELSLLLPELRDRCRDLPILSGDEAAARTRLFEAWARLGQALAVRAPLVLFLDDAQWADATSLDVLRYAARRWVHARVPVLLIVALRSEAVATTPALGEWLAALRRDIEVTKRELGPLTLGDTKRLLRDTQQSGSSNDGFDLFARWLFDETEGQPFFVVEMLRSLVEQGLITPQRSDGGTWVVDSFAIADWDTRRGPLSAGVRRLVQDRLTQLSPIARDLLAAASVLGQECGFERLCLVGRFDEEDALTALDTVLRSGLLNEGCGGDGLRTGSRYIFAHDKIRDVVYAEAGDARRRVFHRRALDVLEPERAPAAELARHALAAGLDEPALHWSLDAGDAAMRVLAARDAVTHYARAIGVAERLGRAEQLTDLHARRGRAFVGVAMWADARRELEIALSGLSASEHERRAEIFIDLAEACFWLLDVPAMRLHASEALALVMHLERDDLKTKALAWLATAEGSAGNLFASVEQNQRAIDHARARGIAPPPVAHFGSMALYWLGRPGEAVHGSREAVATARKANDVSWTMWALPSLGLSLAGTGQYDEATRVFEEARQLGRDYGAETLLARSIACSTGFRLDLFDYSGSEACSHEARDLARSLDFTPPGISAGIDLVMNYARRGEVGRAEPLVVEVEAGVEHAAGFHGWLWRLRFAEARAELALARGDWDAALHWSNDAIAQSATRGRVKYQVLGQIVRAQALHAIGRTREAIADLQSSVALARPVGDPALLLRAVAGLLAVDGNDTLAAEGRALFTQVGERLADPEARRRFLEAEPLRIISGVTGSRN